MNFLVNAQLPRRLIYPLREAGHDAIHTLDLPEKNATPDADVIAVCEAEDRVLISKDADFVDSFWVLRQPSRLLLISLGNNRNQDLEALFIPLIPTIVTAFQQYSFIELNRTSLIYHI